MTYVIAEPRVDVPDRARTDEAEPLSARLKALKSPCAAAAALGADPPPRT